MNHGSGSFWSVIAFMFVLSWLQLSGQGVSAFHIGTSEEKFEGDFLEYWASARLILTGKDPYSPEQVLDVQRSVVWNKSGPTIMWNPPWTLFFIMPFGLLTFATGQLLWLILNTACLLVCSTHLWRIYGGAPERYRLGWMICFSLVPTYGILYMTQITPLPLLGITAFLHYQERNQWWRAGAVLPLIAIKPHLVYLLPIALVLWALEQHRWKLIVAGCIAGILTILTPLLFNPAVIRSYVYSSSANAAFSPFQWATPTLSNALLLFLGHERLWVRYVPPLCGVIWFLYYWRKQHDHWNWSERMPLLLLVSQATTIFAWTYDQVLLLPAFIQVTIWSLNSDPFKIVTALLGFLVINIPTLLVISGVLIPNGFWLFWVVPICLLIYLTLARRVDFDLRHA